MVLSIETQNKINEFVERVKRSQVKVKEDSEGLIFEDASTTYRLLRQNGISGDRSRIG